MADKHIDTTSDHDGRDLRELLADHAQPPSWPDDPFKEPAKVIPEYRDADRETMTDEDWKLVHGLDQRILDGKLRWLSGSWMAAALHMENLAVFDVWVDTFASKVLQPYYLWRRDKQKATKLPEQETLCKMGFFLTHHYEDQQALVTGEFPVAMDMAEPEWRANTLACQTVVAAARLIKAYPSFFPPKEGPAMQRFFGVHTDHFLLAIFVVRYYWNRRTTQGNKYLLGHRRQAYARPTYVTRLTDASKELGPVAPEEPLEIEGTPAKPTPVGTKKPARTKQPKPVVKKDTTEQEKKIRRAIDKLTRRIQASDDYEKEHLEWLREERRDDLDLLLAEPQTQDMPAMSDADLARLTERLRALTVVSESQPPQPLPVDIPKDQMSSIFEVENQTVLTGDEEANLGEGVSVEEAQQDDLTLEQAWADAEATAMQQKRQNELEGGLPTTEKRRIAALMRKKDTIAIRAIAASGARNPDELSVAKSVELMGADSTQWEEMPVNPSRPSFTYRPHQLSAIGTLVQALESPKKMSILAMGTGTGKTITYMGAAQHYNRRRQADIEDGLAADTDPTYRPVMVFTLATITPQTFKEITDHFNGIFTIYCVYGTAAHERDEDLRARIIGGDEFLNRYKNLDIHDPRTANTVFITSYMTFVRRFTYQKKDEPYDRLNEDERQYLGLLEAPADPTQTFTLARLKEPLHVGILICDEAHVIKNVAVRMHLAIAGIGAQVRIMSSATPLLNRPDDVVAYLSLGFKHIPEPPTPKGWPLATLYNDKLDPHAKIGTQPYRHCGTDKMMKACPMSGPCALDDDHPGFRAIREAFDTHGERLWLLSPHLYRSTATQGAGSYMHYDTALRYIMQYFCIRRDMDTAIELPNGQFCTPGDGIPAAHYVTKQVSLIGEGKVEHDELFKRISPYLYKRGKAGQDEAATPGSDGKAPVRKIDHGAWRMADLIANNPNDGKLLRVGEWLQKKEARASSGQQGSGQKGGQKGSQQGSGSPNTGGPDDEDQDDEDQDSDDEAVALGVAQTNAVVEEYRGNHAAYMFRQTAGDDRVPVPRSRVELVLALIRKSAVASAALVEAIEIIQGPREKGLPNRLVVMVDSPWTQLFATTIFEQVGFKTTNIRAVQSPEQRQAVINLFNDPDSDVDILVTNIRLSSAGVNLHLACNRGQLWCCPWNASTVLQILGRLVRIGQAREVQWTIFTVAGTIFELRELNAWKKYARNLAAESILSGIQAQWGIGAMYEVLRVLFGQSFSRYIFEVLQPAVGAFMNDKLVTLAHAVSDIIRHALSTEEAKQVLNQKKQLDLIACGIRLTQARQATPDLAVSTEFIQQNADIIPFESEAVDVGCEVANDNLTTDIKKNKDGRLGLASHSSRKRKRNATTPSKQTGNFKSAEMAYDTSESDDSPSPLAKKSKQRQTGVGTSNDA